MRQQTDGIRNEYNEDFAESDASTTEPALNRTRRENNKLKHVEEKRQYRFYYYADNNLIGL
jgi:hypothetical protein